jgi:3-oxoacyl-[acyl-carrier protein] reductase
MDTGLGGKMAMVSGASKGIGRAVAEKLAAEGVRLSLCARGADQLRAVAHELEDKHGAAPVTRMPWGAPSSARDLVKLTAA